MLRRAAIDGYRREIKKCGSLPVESPIFICFIAKNLTENVGIEQR